MLKEALIQLFVRDLQQLKREIMAYQDEAKLWELTPHIANSAGTLCLHLVGNLKHFIGHGLGKTGYIRQRAREFAARNVPRADLVQEIEETIVVVEEALQGLNAAELTADFPMVIWKEPMSMTYTLVHLHGHLTYHLGQVTYHRKLLAEA